MTCTRTPTKPLYGMRESTSVQLRSSSRGDCAIFSTVSDTRGSTYLIFTAFLTAECSTVELPGSSATDLFSFYYGNSRHATTIR
jgi:hypothetical protein